MDIHKKESVTLKELRKSKGVNQSEIAALLGVTPQAYQKYEYGTAELTHKNLCKLADFYGVSTDYLLGRDAPPPPDIDDILRRCDLSKTEQRFISLYVRIDRKHRAKLVEALEQAAVGAGVPVGAGMPVGAGVPADVPGSVIIYLPTSSAPVSAGTGVYVDDYNQWERKGYIDDGSYRSLDECYVLRIKGDSMEPMFRNGDYIVVNPGLDVDMNEIGVFMLDDEEGYVKKFRGDCLRSLNEEYADIPLSGGGWRRCGKVLGTIQPYK